MYLGTLDGTIYMTHTFITLCSFSFFLIDMEAFYSAMIQKLVSISATPVLSGVDTSEECLSSLADKSVFLLFTFMHNQRLTEMEAGQWRRLKPRTPDVAWRLLLTYMFEWREKCVTDIILIKKGNILSMLLIYYMYWPFMVNDTAHQNLSLSSRIILQQKFPNKWGRWPLKDGITWFFCINVTAPDDRSRQ